MTDGGLVPSQTYKDLVACEDNTAVLFFSVLVGNGVTEKQFGKMVTRF